MSDTSGKNDNKPKTVIVIGGGVAGLTAAHELQERGFKVEVYERNAALGGKARSLEVENGVIDQIMWSFVVEPQDRAPAREEVAQRIEAIRKTNGSSAAEQESNGSAAAGVEPTRFDPNPRAWNELSAIAGLPAEHGFRFFPSFYKHLTDTLSRIPSPDEHNPNRCVADNLVKTERAALAREGKPFFEFPTEAPTSVSEWKNVLRKMFYNPALGLGMFEARYASEKIVYAMTMCQERRECELDSVAWWDYMEADDFSDAYKSVIVNGLTQNFVAMDARHSSTKSVINILARLLNDFIRPNGTMDRILNGPTSEVWIDRWVSYLAPPAWTKGSHYIAGARVQHSRPGSNPADNSDDIWQCLKSHTSSDTNAPGQASATSLWRRTGQTPVTFYRRQAVDWLVYSATDSKITGIKLRDHSGKDPSASYYIAAVPIEAMIEILENTIAHSPEFEVDAESLAGLRDGRLKTSWMNGIMFYLRNDVTMDAGHVVYADSKWALTSISQNQFWSRKVPSYNDQAHGILSVIISDWLTRSERLRKSAQECGNLKDLAEETLAQIRDHLRGSTLVNIDWPNIVGYFLDPAILWRDAIAGSERLQMKGLLPAREFARRKKILREAPDRKIRAYDPPEDYISDIELFGFETLPDAQKDEFTKFFSHYIDQNLEPMFINTVDSWLSRPDARTSISNLFLASDYVKTNTDLATMEGANEAARRAVNSLLDQHEQPQVDKITQVEDIGKRERKLRRCEIFEFDEPAAFALEREKDKFARKFVSNVPHLTPWAPQVSIDAIISRIAPSLSRLQ